MPNRLAIVARRPLKTNGASRAFRKFAGYPHKPEARARADADQRMFLPRLRFGLVYPLPLKLTNLRNARLAADKDPFPGARLEGEEVVHLGGAEAVEALHLGTAARLADQEIHRPVLVADRGHRDAVPAPGGVGHEAVQDLAGVAAVEDADVRAAVGAGAGDQVDLAVAVGVAGGNEDRPLEAGVVGEEVLQHRARVGAAEDFHRHSTAAVAGGDEVGDAVAVEVGGGQVDAAG